MRARASGPKHGNAFEADGDAFFFGAAAAFFFGAAALGAAAFFFGAAALGAAFFFNTDDFTVAMTLPENRDARYRTRRATTTVSALTLADNTMPQAMSMMTMGNGQSLTIA